MRFLRAPPVLPSRTHAILKTFCNVRAHGQISSGLSRNCLAIVSNQVKIFHFLQSHVTNDFLGVKPKKSAKGEMSFVRYTCLWGRVYTSHRWTSRCQRGVNQSQMDKWMLEGCAPVTGAQVDARGLCTSHRWTSGCQRCVPVAGVQVDARGVCTSHRWTSGCQRGVYQSQVDKWMQEGCAPVTGGQVDARGVCTSHR
jgi:hypothetical protein